MMRFTLRELIFGCLAVGSTVGVFVNNYWMEQEIIKARIARHEVCLSLYLENIERLKVDCKCKDLEIKRLQTELCKEKP